MKWVMVIGLIMFVIGIVIFVWNTVEFLVLLEDLERQAKDLSEHLERR